MVRFFQGFGGAAAAADVPAVGGGGVRLAGQKTESGGGEAMARGHGGIAGGKGEGMGVISWCGGSCGE